MLRATTYETSMRRIRRCGPTRSETLRANWQLRRCPCGLRGADKKTFTRAPKRARGSYATCVRPPDSERGRDICRSEHDSAIPQLTMRSVDRGGGSWLVSLLRSRSHSETKDKYLFRGENMVETGGLRGCENRRAPREETVFLGQSRGLCPAIHKKIDGFWFLPRRDVVDWSRCTAEGISRSIINSRINPANPLQQKRRHGDRD